ncbi:MAG: hypothetical protein WCI57_04085 [Candidatus Berkelbacteria bacterium]
MTKFEELVSDLGLGKAFLMHKEKFPDDFTQTFEEWKNHYNREFQNGPKYGQGYRIAILWKLSETSSNYDGKILFAENFGDKHQTMGI